MKDVIMMESEEYKNLDEAVEIPLEADMKGTPCEDPMKSDNPAVVARAMGLEKPEVIEVERPPVPEFEKDDTPYDKKKVQQADIPVDNFKQTSDSISTELGNFRATVVSDMPGASEPQIVINRTIAAHRLKKNYEDKLEMKEVGKYVTDPSVIELAKDIPQTKDRNFRTPPKNQRRKFGFFQTIIHKARRLKQWWKVRQHHKGIKKVPVSKITEDDLSKMSRANEGSGKRMNMIRDPKTGSVVVAPLSAKQLKEQYPNHEVVESRIRGD